MYLILAILSGLVVGGVTAFVLARHHHRRTSASNVKADGGVASNEAANEQRTNTTPVPEATFAIGDPGRADWAVEGPPAPPWGRPDTVVDGPSLGVVEVRAASVRGISHRAYTRTRQDEYALATTDSGHLILVVSDGLGSLEESHRAAAAVCRHGCKAIREALVNGGSMESIDWVEVLNQIAAVIVRADVALQSASGGRTSSDGEALQSSMAATALFAVVETETEPDTPLAAVIASYGDCSAWILEGHSWTAVTRLKATEATFSTSAVYGLPTIAEEALEVHQLELPVGGLMVLMSDGVGDPMANGDGQVGAALADAWAQPPNPLDFARQVGFARKSFDDDRTVVGVWHRR